MRPPPDTENYFKSNINTLAYFNAGNKTITAINLMTNGFQILHYATIFKYFDIYKNIKYSDSTPPELEVIWPFIRDNLIDQVRIITCFENFMKAKLIMDDFVVHKVSKKYKHLSYLQQQRPVMVPEIFSELSFKNFNAEKLETWETTIQTINFSWLLKSKYQEIINLPNDILSILKNLNNERNQLHFFGITDFSFGVATIEIYSKIIGFCDSVIKQSILDLDKSLEQMLNDIQNNRMPF